MGILSFFFARREAASAGIAKERLQIVLAHERAGRNAPDFLPALQRDLIAVVRRYVAIKEELISVNLARQKEASVLEINIELDPAKQAEKPAPVAADPAAVAARGRTAGKRR
jgi:cell division topological specificity factor